MTPQQNTLDKEHMLEDLYKEVTGSGTKVVIIDEPLKDHTVFRLVVPKMDTAQDEEDAIKRMFKPIKDSKYASKLIYVYVAPTLIWFYFTNDNVQAMDKLTNSLNKLSNVLIGNLLSGIHKELTGKKIVFSVSSEPVDVSEYKKNLHIGYESHFKECMNTLLFALAEQHDPEYVVVVIADNQIWFYFN